MSRGRHPARRFLRANRRREVVAAVMALNWVVFASPLARADTSLAKSYESDAARILGAALLSDAPYRMLGELCDRFGNRLSGSPQLEATLQWCVEEMETCGLENVHLEDVMVPVWVRGEESAALLQPVRRDLHILGLGGSVGTPPQGIEADAVVVDSFDALRQLGRDRVAGHIVLYDVPFTSYGETVEYRGKGATEAAKLGAVAVLVRSVTPVSLDTPHTGAMHYDDEVAKIPAAAVTLENATMMHRMQDRGEPVRVHLDMGARTLPDAPSHNVIGEIVGDESPREIVVIGGHIDSWDVGQGAQDDGVGCMIALGAARLLRELGLKPRRTIRVVLFTNEENGLAGGKAYRDAHRDEIERHVAAIESDSGNGRAHGFRLDIRPAVLGMDPETEEADLTEPQRTQLADIRATARARLREIAPLLRPLDAGEIRIAGSGADVSPMVENGVLGLGVQHDTTKYWEIHHTQADTFDKIVPEDLARNVAVMAIMTYVLADMPDRVLAPAVAPSR
jgi:carboxypeptidase Q